MLKDPTKPDSGITGGTLTLYEGFDAKEKKVILPDVAVTIVTTGDSTIGTLTTAKHEQGASATIQLAFSGRGKLEITKRIELSGGDYNTLTVAEDAIVTASKGISIGSGSEVILTVNGTLTAEGYYDDGYKANVPAISAGKVTVGDTGVLEVSGGAGVMLNGNASDLDDFTNMFTVTKDGRFTGDCSEYNVCIVSNSGNLPEGTDAKKAIALGADYLPADCEAGITTDSNGNKQINLVRKSTGQVYTGSLTIHKNHIYDSSWKHDKDTHWHPCKFAGCDKKDGEAAHTFGTDGVCTICGAKLEVNLTDTDLVYDGTAKKPGVTVTITADATTITLTKDTDYTVSYDNNTDAGTGTVTVTGSGDKWTVTKTFTIAKATPTLTAPTASNIAYGQKLSDSSLTGGTAKDPQNNDVPGTWSWADPNTQPTVTGDFKVKFTPNDTKNYKTPETNPTTNVTVNPAKPELTLNAVPSEQVAGGEVAVSCTVVNPHDSALTDVPEAALTYKVGDDGAEQNITGGKFTIPEGTAKGTTITVTASTAAVIGKYNANTKTDTVTVTDKPSVTITGVEALGGTYNGRSHPGYTGTPTAASYTGGFTVTYSRQDGASYNDPAIPPTDAGAYTVTISLADTSAYTGSLPLDFTIAPATITITADNKQATVGSAKPALTYTVSGLVEPDALVTEPTPACDADMNRAGSYPITVTGAAVPSGGNYDPEIIYIPGTLTVTEPYVPPVHRHNWSTAWAFDSTRHWHRCLNGCSERNNVAEHVYDDEWDTGCNICGYERGVEPPPHVHDWDSAWSKDDTHHWHECLADGCTITGDSGKDGYEEHVYDDEWDTDCNVCGYVREVTPPEPEHTHVWSEEWSHDEARHWHECTAPGCDITDNSQKDGYEEHVYDDEQDTDCNICGYEREVEPPPHAHDWDSAWSGDSSHHWHECLAEGCGITADSEKDGYGGHTPGGWIIDYPAASTTTGRRYRACTVCGRVLETESIPAAGGSHSGGGGSSVRTYAITVEKSEHGKVAASRTNAASGTKVTLTVTPDTGYVLLDLAVTDSRGNPVSVTEQNTFTMPGRAVTVRASFAPLPDESQEEPCDGGADCPSRAYADLSTGAWYHEAADYAIREGLLTGYGNGTFNPNGNLSRAMLAQILYNREGRPSVEVGSSFVDVAPESWYADAVMWAAAQGIIGGYGNGKFGPNDHITREQLAVMLWRYSKEPAAAGKELHFNDADQASSWALEALRWAAETGVLNGKGGGILEPKGLATRAEVLQMLKNLVENLKENA